MTLLCKRTMQAKMKKLSQDSRDLTRKIWLKNARRLDYQPLFGRSPHSSNERTAQPSSRGPISSSLEMGPWEPASFRQDSGPKALVNNNFFIYSAINPG